MLVNNSFLAESAGLTPSELRKNEQTKADFAEYLNLDEPTPEEILKKITKNGVQSLLEHKIDMLKKQLTEQAMAARGVSHDDLAAMPAEESAKIMEEIMKQVQEQLKMAINEQMKKEKKMEIGFLDNAPIQREAFAQILAAQEIGNA